MRSVPTFIGAAALAGLALIAPSRSIAQPKGAEPVTLRKAQDEFTKLQGELARVNAEIAQLKRSDRSVRNDYRLRDRMADGEALAQRLGQAEIRMRSLERPPAPQPRDIPLVPPPQASPQDGSVELEAKADLFADQASKLEKQAEVFDHAADQLRSRKALRRRAGAWERDPFAGLESSKRNLAASSSTQKGATGTSPLGTAPAGDNGAKSGGTATTGSTSGSTTGPTPSGTANPGEAAQPTAGTPIAVAAPGSTFDGARGPSPVGATESPASKSSPLAPTVASDRTAEQRFFLDPTTVAELRQALGMGGVGADPEALDRAAAALHARARQLSQQADSLRRKSRGQ